MSAPLRAGPRSGAASGRSPAASVPPLTVLVVDDDLLHARLLRANLSHPARVRAEVAGSASEALQRIAAGGVDAVVTDLVMPGMDGIELTRRIRAAGSTIPVVLVSAAATLERGVEAMRAGATDVAAKPVNVTTLLARIKAAVAPGRAAAAVETPGGGGAERWIFGDHPRLAAVCGFAEQVARTPWARVLVTGESGTGKSLLARAIHHLSGAAGAFVEVNCAALPPQLLEAELFGYEKGAFTDAKEQKRGLVEAAEGGTLFLDEVDTLPLEVQSKLLVFLETRDIRRVGGVQGIAVRTRVVTATGADLHRLAREGRFRRDLLFRLDVAAVEMPPLRAMPEVIPGLVARFAAALCAEHERPVPELDAAALAAAAADPWPGNARELRNAVERALIFHRGGPLEVHPPVRRADAAEGADGSTLRVPLGTSLEEVERRYLAAVLEAFPTALATVAERLGISRKTLWEKRRRYGL
ncbi:MAG: sigma-54-dependent transcriptional regulator [Longimicrobiaceae bacterium]